MTSLQFFDGRPKEGALTFETLTEANLAWFRWVLYRLCLGQSWVYLDKRAIYVVSLAHQANHFVNPARFGVAKIRRLSSAYCMYMFIILAYEAPIHVVTAAPCIHA